MCTVNGPPAGRSSPSAPKTFAWSSGFGAAGTISCPATPPGYMPNSSARPPGFGAGTSPVLGVSPTQSADAPPGNASATAAATALAPLRHRVRRAQLGPLGGLVRLPRGPAEREDTHTLVARVDLPLRGRPNADDGVRIHRQALPLDVDLAAPTHHDVDLLLPVAGVVVLRELL